MDFQLCILDDISPDSENSNGGEGGFCWRCTVVSNGCVGCEKYQCITAVQSAVVSDGCVGCENYQCITTVQSPVVSDGCVGCESYHCITVVQSSLTTSDTRFTGLSYLAAVIIISDTRLSLQPVSRCRADASLKLTPDEQLSYSCWCDARWTTLGAVRLCTCWWTLVEDCCSADLLYLHQPVAMTRHILMNSVFEYMLTVSLTS